MRWRKRDLWKIGITVAGTLFLLMFIIWVPISTVDAHQQSASETPVAAGTITAQATPTEDATVTALNKEKLVQEVQQLTQQSTQQQHTWENWLWSNAATIISTFLSTLVIVIGALFGLWRWRRERQDAQDKELKDRQNEREKRAEERFQAAVTGLGDDKEGARIGAAIVLRTFLREGEGYEQFYAQIFELAVSYLRLRPCDADTARPLDSLSQALIMLFKESFPLIRNQHPSDKAQQLDAARIQLDNAFLAFADLQQAWMPFAHLREANLHQANLNGANLHQANLSGANLHQTNLSGANFYRAHLNKATLYRAHLSKTNLRGAHLCGTQLGSANLRGTDLTGADLRGAILGGSNLGHASSLTHTNLCGVKELTKEQLEACKAKGAIIDEAPTTSPSQSIVAPPPPVQSNAVPTTSTPPAQGSLLTPDTDGSSATSPQQEAEL